MEKRSLESCTILLLTGNHTATKGFIFWSGMFSHAVHPHGFAKHRFDDLITTICFQYSSATEWVKLFLTLKDKEVGYAKGDITPYIHVLVYDVPRFFKNSGVKIFTGQGVEKTNDVVRSIYHNKCNKHDGCKDTLLALKRLDCPRDNERKPNKYTTKNEEYWFRINCLVVYHSAESYSKPRHIQSTGGYK